jgi:hypothetical protein
MERSEWEGSRERQEIGVNGRGAVGTGGRVRLKYI